MCAANSIYLVQLKVLTFTESVPCPIWHYAFLRVEQNRVEIEHA